MVHHRSGWQDTWRNTVATPSSGRKRRALSQSVMSGTDSLRYLKKFSGLESLIRRRDSVRHTRQRQTSVVRCDDDVKMIGCDATIKPASSECRPFSDCDTSTAEHNNQLSQLPQGSAAAAVDSSLLTPSDGGTSACVCVSELRLPLFCRAGYNLRRRTDTISKSISRFIDSHSRRHAVFCRVHCGGQVRCTKVVATADGSLTDLEFDEVFKFERVEADFRCVIEVMSKCECRDHQVQSTSAGRTTLNLRGLSSRSNVRCAMSAAATPASSATALNGTVIDHSRSLSLANHEHLQSNGTSSGSHQFQCIGSVLLTAADIEDSVRSHCLVPTLVAAPPPATSRAGGATGESRRRHCGPPLFGQICCRLSALPELHCRRVLRQQTLAVIHGTAATPSVRCVSLTGTGLDIAPTAAATAAAAAAAVTPDTSDSVVDHDEIGVADIHLNNNNNNTSTCTSSTISIAITKDTSVTAFSDTSLAKEGAPHHCLRVHNTHSTTDTSIDSGSGSVVLCLDSPVSQLTWSRDITAAVNLIKSWRRAGAVKMTLPAPAVAKRRTDHHQSLYERISTEEAAMASADLSPLPLCRTTRRSSFILPRKIGTALTRLGNFSSVRFK